MNDGYRRFLAIDYGSVRIGLALSDPMKIIASGYRTIPNDAATLDTLLSVIAEQDVERIIVGNPLTLKGEIGAKAEEVALFVTRLKEKTALPVVMVDERFTSVMAQRSIRTMGVKKSERKNNKGKVDEIAAAILLQGYLDANPR